MFEAYNNKKLIGLESIKNKVLDDFFDNRLHHSLMFLGNIGIGKSTMAYHLANKILDDENILKQKNQSSLFGEVVDDSILNENNPTFNLIKNKKHPDLLVIEKEVDAKTSKIGKEIKVASARKILDFMSLAPFISKNKVIIVDSIDEMNISAQNAILKALEEPAKNTYIFLICHNVNNVLDTIISRCRKITIPNHSYEIWKEILYYISPDKIKLLQESQLLNLYEISNASISFALNILEEDGLFLYETIENILSDKIPNVENIQNLGEQLANNEKLFSLFNNFILLFLYKILKYLAIGTSNDSFKEKNSNFILKNNEKTIINKIKLTQEILRDIDNCSLNKKHAINVLFILLMR